MTTCRGKKVEEEARHKKDLKLGFLCLDLGIDDALAICREIENHISEIAFLLCVLQNHEEEHKITHDLSEEAFKKINTFNLLIDTLKAQYRRINNN